MRVLVAVVVGTLGWARAQAAVLERIEIVGQPASAVRLHLSEPAPAVVRALPSEPGPDRIYLDLGGTLLGAGARTSVAGAGSLIRVRAAQFDPGTTRVVLDLAYAMPFAVRPAGRTVLVEFGAQLLAPPRDAPRPDTLVAEVAPRDAPAPTSGASAPTADAPAPTTAGDATDPRPSRESRAPRLALAGPAERRPSVSMGPPAPPPASIDEGATARALPDPADLPPPPVRRPGLPVVVLDAGHGGRDPGAAGVGGVLEKDIVLQVTRRLAAHLAARLPVSVVMTRTDDSFLPIERRLAMAGEGTVLFLSLHANSCSDPAARGLEIFYGGGDVRTVDGRGASPRAALLGRCLDDALRAHVGPVRGDPRPADFGVLVRNTVPSALVEIGYLTHPAEAARTQDGQYQDLLAEALTDGVAAFLRASAPPL